MADHPFFADPAKLRALLLTSLSVTDALRQADLRPHIGTFQAIKRASDRHGLGAQYQELTLRGRNRRRERFSVVWDRERLLAAAEGASTMVEVMTALGFSETSSGNRQRVRMALIASDVDLPSRCRPPTDAERRAAIAWASVGRPDRSTVKRSMIAAGLLVEKCYGHGCPVADTWNDRPIVLQLDHIDGDRWNDAIENLRLLCPNCHSQTPTYSGRNIPQVHQAA